MKFVNAYYVHYTFNDNPFFIGPYYTLEEAEKSYNRSIAELDLQIIRTQVAK